jgi:NADH:ubiquinone oxidoreductase subunit K
MFEIILAGLFVVGLLLSAHVWRSRSSESSGAPTPDGGTLPESAGTEAGSETDEKLNGLRRWLTTTDHHDIGIMYIVFGMFAGLWGGVDAMMIRTEFLTPAANINLVALSAQHGTLIGQVFSLSIITLAAAEVTIGIGIVLVLYRNFVGVDVTQATTMRW